MNKETFRSDYRALPIEVASYHLQFYLDIIDSANRTEITIVKSAIEIDLKPEFIAAAQQNIDDLFLNGRSDVKLLSVSLNGARILDDEDNILWVAVADGLVFKTNVLFPFLDKTNQSRCKKCKLEIEVQIDPKSNTLLEGLYKSGGMFCTQCEAEGFRGITYFFDRPDILTIYTVRIEANKVQCPVLLSNGNKVECGDVEGDSERHFAVWQDPFPKPCYLFALVAGDLKAKTDSFITCSGKAVSLFIWTPEKDVDQVAHAMSSLKHAMRWDEDMFGREYDLELFNIVAVPDFNMGAMENKSLNVFNSRLVLGTPLSCTDAELDRIQGIIAHEYFHNWTGNRVTCRDWFQLTLKEGLTVYRDQEFTSCRGSRSVKRIQDVLTVRTLQFAEDAGPTAHPIRPDSYLKMDNFYSSTVYRKGAEVVRMYEALLGPAGFRAGMDLYFARHDGQAVTCEAFLEAMQDASGQDLRGLLSWYSRKGTPAVTAELSREVDSEGQVLLCLQLTQSLPADQGGPLLIPFRMALLGPDGLPLPLCLLPPPGVTALPQELGPEAVLRLAESRQQFVFRLPPSSPSPVASLLRGFSAPVRLTVHGQTDEDLLFLLAHDSDAFSRFEAGQQLARQLLLGLYARNLVQPEEADEALVRAEQALAAAFRGLLVSPQLDGQFKALAVSLPARAELQGLIPLCNPLALHHQIAGLARRLAASLRTDWQAIADGQQQEQKYYQEDDVVGGRKALFYLALLGDPAVEADLLERQRHATNMTDELAALTALVGLPLGHSLRDQALSLFLAKWSGHSLVLLKWLSVQALSEQPALLHCPLLQALAQPRCGFSLTNPNSVLALFWSFAQTAEGFHAADGSGYRFLADAVLQVDAVNHQGAARLVKCFSGWRGWDLSRQVLATQQLSRVLSSEGLSANVFEIASKSMC
eukprot:CAMPEP_0170061954 /NCGR_PEP_ID=MMETSP0019_2-20121128/3352_1 /TAXON_ID=98059 /ORGANISM="Dinobryon sp., Strain UTEXLB2267" /LENGTH=922 /DNA_ID=CAMNT_0010267961 /DNA_START=14 /DNA_END=2782 /DNA_ORIENTATION=+